MGYILFQIFKFLTLIILPFAILIRGATYFHDVYEYSAMGSILISSIMTAAILFFYFTFFYGWITGKLGKFDGLKWRFIMAILVVVVYASHGIFFMSKENVKQNAIKNELHQLHPILRLSLGTLVHIDKKLLITDASRQPEDYQKMGLPTKSVSLHYKQASSNYVHAVDLRTNGRSELRNLLTAQYFNLLGFNTLRHFGTADHLHVSLKSHDYPHAK